MSSEKRKVIAILTSGGDCPGLNAVIRSVIASATKKGCIVIGIKKSTHGLATKKSVYLNKHFLENNNNDDNNNNESDNNISEHDNGLNWSSIDPLLTMGGTFLKSINKRQEGDTDELIISGYHHLNIDVLIGIGGDGSIRFLSDYAARGNWNFIAIPKTIDNDVPITEYSVGFSTAVDTVTNSIHHLTTTALSHDRIMILEVMGRTAGHLALHSGIAGGSDIILIPEIPYSLDKIIEKISFIREKLNRHFAIIVVAEGALTLDGTTVKNNKDDNFGGIGNYLANCLREKCDSCFEIRAMALGHIQRGGNPSAQDRILATTYGAHAVDLAVNGNYDRMVSWNNGTVTDVPIEDVLEIGTQLVEPKINALVKVANDIGIYVGDLDKIQDDQ
eukprot:TRINITY_DN12901_c0_g1_i1.p1 TRINITY_DN12901_c0_g1~~TRINITY_DN12901_c0_g1_i1.p1  ORF type:complete len:389 (-),score=131.30 TRINITY_DN12901_c0_g1_i1:79-1245(-)